LDIGLGRRWRVASHCSAFNFAYRLLKRRRRRFEIRRHHFAHRIAIDKSHALRASEPHQSSIIHYVHNAALFNPPLLRYHTSAIPIARNSDNETALRIMYVLLYTTSILHVHIFLLKPLTKNVFINQTPTNHRTQLPPPPPS
jgi:hypothetical protein